MSVAGDVLGQKIRILVLEGGGAKGPFEVGVLETLEKKTGKKVWELFDLVITTSIGSVIGSVMCTGVYRAREFNYILTDEIPNIFDKRFLRVPIYDRSKYSKLLKKHVENKIGKPLKMSDMKTMFAHTSTNMCDGLNHFFKSWKDDEGDELVSESVPRSFAAPYFFGQINDPKRKAVWLDGGCGAENLPLWEALVEAYRRGWLPAHKTHILAIGSGRAKYWLDYEEASKGNALQRTWRAVRYFNSYSKGSLARNQSTMVQVRNVKALAEVHPNLSFQFIDWSNMPKKLDKMDNVKARYEYRNRGKLAGEDIDLQPFV